MRKFRSTQDTPRMPAMTDEELDYLWTLGEDGEIPVKKDPVKLWHVVQFVFATVVLVSFYGLLAYGIFLWIRSRFQ